MLVRVVLVVAVASMVCGVASGAMNEVAPGLWVGNQHAAGRPDVLAAANITAVLNVAWDLDIRYAGGEYEGDVSDNNERLRAFQYAKVGLVDGEGNAPEALAGAVLALSAFMTPRVGMSPDDAAKYSQPVSNVLVHCHSGQSRSVTVASLYLTLTGAFPTYKAALAHVRSARGLTGVYPAHALTALAHKLVNHPFAINVLGTPAPPSPPAPPPSSPSSGDAIPVSGAKHSSMSAGVVALVAITLFFVVAAVTVAVIAHFRPDSPVAVAAGNCAARLPCRRSSGLASAYSMSASPDFDF